MTVKERALDARLPRRRRRVLPAYLPYVLPLVLLLLLVNLYPTIYEIVTSFTSRKLGPAPGEFVGLDNFRRLTADPRFWNSIWVTLRLLLYALPAEMIAGTALALLLHASPFRRAFLPLLLLPIVTTPVVSGFIFKYMFQEDYGLISHLLKLANLFPGFNLTANIRTVLPALAFVDFWQWTPFVTLVVLAGLSGIPGPILEAASLDGASPWQRLTLIVLPLLKGELLVAMLFRTVDLVKIYDVIYAITRGGPGSFSESASIYLQISAFQFRDLGYASAIGLVLIAVSLSLANLYLRALRGLERAR